MDKVAHSFFWSSISKRLVWTSCRPFKNEFHLQPSVRQLPENSFLVNLMQLSEHMLQIEVGWMSPVEMVIR